MVQPIKPPLAATASYIGVLVQVFAALLLIQLPANVPGKAEDGGPSTWVPAILVGDQYMFTDSWLQPGSALLIMAI